MKFKRTLLVVMTLSVLAAGMVLLAHVTPPILQKQAHTEYFGDIAIAEPLWGAQGLILVFVDTRKFPAKALAQRLAATGVTAAIIDIATAYKSLDTTTGACLTSSIVSKSIDTLINQLPKTPANRLIVAGMGDGALVPFLNAQDAAGNEAINLSIGFSAVLPAEVAVCPPSVTSHKQYNILVSSPAPGDSWRAVWADQPPDETAVFIRTLGDVHTRIAAYDTPLDSLLIEEVQTAIGQSRQASPPLPVVEVPAVKPGETVTLFYSGDGGWRDLDRAVAAEMAAHNYPVVGVDVLRYFWEHKTPEQAASDLSAAMAYYRKAWGVKSFVLAGYSFGADILPPIYNRLPKQDRDSVKLVVLVALATKADFEIHVSGWLGQGGGERLLAPELAQMPKQKILCVYGQEEKDETACVTLINSEASILELPGGHHFDQDYPKLTRQILNVYRQHGIQ